MIRHTVMNNLWPPPTNSGKILWTGPVTTPYELVARLFCILARHGTAALGKAATNASNSWEKMEQKRLGNLERMEAERQEEARKAEQRHIDLERLDTK